MRRLHMYRVLLGRWLGMVLGRNTYFHTLQGVGKVFQPGELRGYFSDLTAKTQWQGQTNPEGILINRDTDGNPVYFPIAIAQKGLGHWDSWLLSDRTQSHHWEAVLQICRWLLQNQDQAGGWTIWFARPPGYSTPYSAMAQGEGASLLLRAYTLNHDPQYREGAIRALRLLVREISEGGTAHMTAEGLVLEEFTGVPLNTILNGWIFALYGLYDGWLVERSTWLEEALQSSLNALMSALPRFDLGWWTRYDTVGNLASPFYQQLHIAQLQALELTFPERGDAVRAFRQKWESQHASRLNRMRAVGVKVFQKIVRPPASLTR